MWSFILSEATFFVFLISAFVYYAVYGKTRDPHALSGLNLSAAAVFTFFLLASSFTLWRAERNLEHRNHKGFFAWLTVTIVLGLVFILGQGREYLELLHRGVTLNSSLFASSFFTLTGFHGLHVCVGLIGLLIVLWLGWAGEYKTGRLEAVRTLGLYWHFVDVVWIFVFTTVYVVGPRL
jgi:heme/copper-type cytochrome/quinol oxidase subunit 3